MKSLREGQDYRLYQIYIWGGLAVIVIWILLFAIWDTMGIVDLSDMALLGVIFAPITLWILGILAYWWWVFLFKGNQEFEESLRQRPEEVPKLSALKSWSQLHTAMCIHGGDSDELRETSKAASRPVIIWYGMSNFLVLWILGCAWAYIFFQDVSPVDIRKIMAVGVVVIMVLILVVTPLLLSITIKGGESAYLAPLGLSLVEDTSEDMYISGLRSMGKAMTQDRPTVLKGGRRGRPVHIETIGKRCYTLVQTQTPPFEIHSQEGKLAPGEGAPETVTRALKGLRKAKRWRGIAVTGGAQGVAVERESPGENMWLYDLWLIERLLEQICPT